MLPVISSTKMCLETFNKSFEGTENKQHFDTKTTSIEEREKVMAIVLQIFV